MFEKFTDKARKVMSLAQDEARNLGQMYVGTEHLLLALIREGEGVAAKALAKLEVTYDETLATVQGLTQSETEPVPGGHIPFTPRAKRVLEDAYRETMTHGQNYIATEHLLLGIVAEGNGRAMDALRAMGVSGDAVRNAVNELTANQPDQQAPQGQPSGPVFMGVGGGQSQPAPSDDASMLEQYGRNLTKVAADGKLKVSESFLTPIEQHFNYDYFSGIEAAFDIRRSVGDRVVSIKYKGEELSGDKRLTLCMNNYRASGAGGYDIYRQCQTVRELPTEIAELIIAYVDKHRNITVDKHKWLKLIY